MDLNKGISTPIVILIVVVVAAVVGFMAWRMYPINEPVSSEQASDYTTQSACEEAGYYWYEESCHEEKQEGSSDEPEPTTSKSITVTSPNGGEEWEKGDTYDITWKSKKVDKVDVRLKYRYYVTEGPNSHWIFRKCKLNKNPIKAKRGSYSWTIKDDSCDFGISPGNDFKIIINEVEGPAQVYDESDSYFTIKRRSETANWKAYKSKEFGFEFKHPQGWTVSPYSNGKDLIVEKENCYLNIQEISQEDYQYKDELISQGCSSEELTINDNLFIKINCPTKWGFNRYYTRNDGDYFKLEPRDDINSLKAGEPVPSSYLSNCQSYFDKILSTFNLVE